MKGNGKTKDVKDKDEFEGFNEVDDSEDEDLYTVLDDAGREELEELVGLKVVGLDIWEESLSDPEDAGPVAPADRVYFDCDLLFDDGLALELYVAAAYPDPDGDPLKGMDTITATLEKIADQQLELLDFDEADEEGGLAVAFGADEKTALVVVASAWLVSEWEEDGDESAEDEDEEPGQGEAQDV